jgi:hypothetical protein
VSTLFAPGARASTFLKLFSALAKSRTLGDYAEASLGAADTSVCATGLNMHNLIDVPERLFLATPRDRRTEAL